MQPSEFTMYHVSMRWLARTRPGKIVMALVLACSVGIFIQGYYFEPHVRSATLAEVESVLPPQLLRVSPRDAEAETRLLRLIALIDSYNPKQFFTLANRMSSILDRMYLADRLWGDTRIENIQQILAQGPVALPSQPLGEQKGMVIASRPVYEMYSQFKEFARALVESASLYQQHGDQKAAIRCLSIALKFQYRIQKMHGPLIQYLVASAIDGLLMHTISDFGADRRCTAAECATLLSAIEPSLKVDSDLAESWRIEFQREDLPHLPNPFRELKESKSSRDEENLTKNQDPIETEFETTYDAFATSKLAGKVAMIAIENALHPLSKFNDEAERIQSQVAKDLPKPPTLEEMNSSRRRSSHYLFRLATYRTPNYYGRVMISDLIGSRNVTEISARNRVLRDSVRVLLASRIYRSAHHGELPNFSDGFLPSLIEWPCDPYDGQPLRYSAAKEVVYGIGSNLIDDGGKIDGPPNRALDRGISLRLRP